MTNQALPCREAFEKWYWAEVRGLSFASARQGWEAACEWMNTRAQSSAPEDGEAVAWASASALSEITPTNARTVNLYGFKPSPRNKISDHVPLYTRSNAIAISTSRSNDKGTE